MNDGQQMNDVQQWQATVSETLQALKDKTSESMWPRDALLNYLQLMEKLQVIETARQNAK